MRSPEVRSVPSISFSSAPSVSLSLNHNGSYFLPSLIRSLLFAILYRSTIVRFQRFLLFQTERIFVVEINLFLPLEEIRRNVQKGYHIFGYR